jgi:hypothetical protein
MLHDLMVRFIVGGGESPGGLKAMVKGVAIKLAFGALSAAGINLPMQVHLDTDEGNACALQDATAFSLFRQSADGGLSLVGRTLVPQEGRSKGRLAVQARELECAGRPGAVLYTVPS